MKTRMSIDEAIAITYMMRRIEELLSNAKIFDSTDYFLWLAWNRYTEERKNLELDIDEASACDFMNRREEEILFMMYPPGQQPLCPILER